jgi:hypothetical protein
MSKKAGLMVSILALYALIANVSAQWCVGNAACTTVCTVMCTVLYLVQSIGGTLVLLMFIYGGLKYVFSADDAGGRKQGKMTCIHAVIGGIIIVMATSLTGLIAGIISCPCQALIGAL